MPTTTHSDTTIRRLAKLNFEVIAMNDAVLAHDLDEARFRTHFIHMSVQDMGFWEVARVAADVVLLLRGLGCDPLPGYGQAMLNLARALTP
ncbi:hypothetical protein VI08_13580 [Luteibacter yeojuensis]|uniref:Uncharacterized protein n=1 Tax=Luteibacter yeojuensis TaxID=345309 RepID=A0A0F3KJF1_9GAMM|nr:hypothetical protein VI08_13580 [Luteibacter yeojuensis]